MKLLGYADIEASFKRFDCRLADLFAKAQIVIDSLLESPFQCFDTLAFKGDQIVYPLNFSMKHLVGTTEVYGADKRFISAKEKSLGLERNRASNF